MKRIGFVILFFVLVTQAQTKTKKVPSISYQNVTHCYPDLKNNKLEFDVDLDELRKTIDEKYPTSKSTLRYRKVLFTDQKLGPETHRLTISLQKWARGIPEYDFYLEKLDKENIAEMVPIKKEKYKNLIKEVPQKYLLDVTLIEDEYFWVDTKPSKIEMSYKLSNNKVIDLDLSHNRNTTQLKCERKKTQGVLCLCLKR